MRLNNVFYGFTIDGKDRCLYRRNRVYFTDMGDVNSTIYYDLEEKREFESSEVDETTLQPITNIVGNKKRERKRKVVELYQADRERIFDIKCIFFGTIIKNVSEYVFPTNIIGISNNVAINKSLQSNVLCVMLNESIGESLNDGICYEIFEEVAYNGDLDTDKKYIDNIEYIYEEEQEIKYTKRKIIETDYRVRSGVK